MSQNALQTHPRVKLSEVTCVVQSLLRTWVEPVRMKYQVMFGTRSAFCQVKRFYSADVFQ